MPEASSAASPFFEKRPETAPTSELTSPARLGGGGALAAGAIGAAIADGGGADRAMDAGADGLAGEGGGGPPGRIPAGAIPAETAAMT